jgi:uncharacterized protein (DUF983 family)
MSFNNYYPNRKDWIKPYENAFNFNYRCRCTWCTRGKLFNSHRKEVDAKDKIKKFLKEGY